MAINETAQKYIDQIKEKCERIKPLVVIRSLIYNHAPYLREALDSFVMQKTEFPYVAIVHDDASTDGTAEILKEYAEKYPDIILPIFEKENQWSKHDGSLREIIHKAVDVSGAKYVALCEGDDYWTNPLKIQLQVNFLEHNPQITLTCHRYNYKDEKDGHFYKVNSLFLDKHKELDGFIFDLYYTMKKDWNTKTLSLVYRRELLDIDLLKNCKYSRDVHYIYMLLLKGNGYCFNFEGGTYRKQVTGIWSQLDTIGKVEASIDVFKDLKNISEDNRLKQIIDEKYKDLLTVYLKFKKFSKILQNLNLKYILYIPILLIDKKFKISDKKENNRIEQLNNQYFHRL